jgi:hypothetical protein
MPLTQQLSELRTSARRIADMERSTFVTDAEIDAYLNLGVRHLWALLFQSDIDRFVVRFEFTTTTGTREYTLPDDFMVVRLLEVLTTSGGEDAYPIQAYNLSEGHTSNTGLFGSAFTDGEHLRYAVYGQGTAGAGTRIRFDPDPQGRTFRLWYVAAPEELSVDGDLFDGVLGWEEWVTLWAGEQMLLKEESDPSLVIRRRQEVTSIMKKVAGSRDVGSAHRVAKVRGRRRRRGLVAR